MKKKVMAILVVLSLSLGVAASVALAAARYSDSVVARYSRAMNVSV